MGLNLFDSSEVDPAGLAAASARCYLALGRLDGAIAYAAPNVVALFAVMLVRRTLARSLAAAGYLFRWAAARWSRDRRAGTSDHRGRPIGAAYFEMAGARRGSRPGLARRVTSWLRSSKC
jgi:hypothetical protein